jgi:hypothetical protein
MSFWGVIARHYYTSLIIYNGTTSAVVVVAVLGGCHQNSWPTYVLLYSGTSCSTNFGGFRNKFTDGRA